MHADTLRAYVLCGGFGTRLRGVIGETQKALVDVQGRPFLSSVLQRLRQAGIKEAVLCAHYRADQLAMQLDQLAADSGVKLDMVVEPEPLGTGGALLHALRERPPAPQEMRYLVLNADTYLEPEAYRLAAQTQGNLLVAAHVADRDRYGGLSIDAQGRLLALLEKGLTGPGLINAGVYAFATTTFTGQPVRPCSLERDLLPRLIEHQDISALQYAGRFIDIGTPESLAHYALDVQTERIP